MTDVRQRTLYGRRRGKKLRDGQQSLLESLLPRLTLAVPPEPQKIDLAKVFGGTLPAEGVWLEVGFGAGEHLVWQAKAHPHVGLIGAEPYEMGMAKLLTKLEETLLNTVRLYEGDGREIIEALPDASLGRFFLLFPDPWPKTRHHKRRFLQMEMLDQLARVLKPGAELRFATDDKSYLPYALERLMAHAKFRWLAEGPSDWKTRPADWPPTRYEAKQIRGLPNFLRFARA